MTMGRIPVHPKPLNQWHHRHLAELNREPQVQGHRRVNNAKWTTKAKYLAVGELHSGNQFEEPLSHQ